MSLPGTGRTKITYPEGSEEQRNVDVIASYRSLNSLQNKVSLGHTNLSDQYKLSASIASSLKRKKGGKEKGKRKGKGNNKPGRELLRKHSRFSLFRPRILTSFLCRSQRDLYGTSGSPEISRAQPGSPPLRGFY